jgi:hypothetical protein
MTGVLEPITFKKVVGEEIKDLVIPKEFIRDFESFDTHLMIYMRVTGPDTWKVSEFFEEQEGNVFSIDTTGKQVGVISEDFILTSVYLDEGPHLSADIDIEPPMVRAILDFQNKSS